LASAKVNGNTYVYSFCGIDSSKNHSGIHLKSFRFNVNQNLWESFPDVPDTLGKIAAAASVIKDTIYIIGGYHVMPNGYEYTSNKVHRFNIVANEFMSDGAPVPVPVDDHVQAVWRDSLIFVITGWSGSGFSGGNVANVQIYNPSLNSWMQATPVPNNNIYKSFGASGVIIGDTIYYYGGANGSSFGPQNQLRKGVINPSDPTQISWSYQIPDVAIKGYRTAAVAYQNQPYWLGGSENTYNYNGVAYDGSGGVPPAKRSLKYLSASQSWDTAYALLPMDLRNAAEIGNGVFIIAGGMTDNQKVSDKTLYLISAEKTAYQKLASKNDIVIFPNPAKTTVHLSSPRAFSLLNINMQEVWSSSIPVSELDISFLPSGCYFLKIKNKNSFVVKKLFKQ
jgi:hypothetical protein